MRPVAFTIASILLFFFLFTSAGLSVSPQVKTPEDYRLALDAELPSFDQQGWDSIPKEWNVRTSNEVQTVFVNPLGPAMEDYRKKMRETADWSGLSVWHKAGSIASTGVSGFHYRLGVNVIVPKGPHKGTFFLLHGYLNHAVNFSYNVEEMARRGWIVITLDLPGHGLSDGSRSDIPDFGDYGNAVESWFAWANRQSFLPRPWIELAHSLGGASTMDYLSRVPGVHADRTILVAPLVHTDWYDALVAAYAVSGWALKELPPMFAWDEYLGGNQFPTHWFAALQKWNERFKSVGAFPMPGLVIQGDNDQVVDENYDIPFLQTKLIKTQFKTVRGGGHLILTDKATRQDTQKLIDDYLAHEGF